MNIMSVSVSRVEGQTDDGLEFVKSAFVHSALYTIDAIISKLKSNFHV